MRFVIESTDPWAPLADGAAPGPHTLLSLDQWIALRLQWPHDLPVGVSLANTVDVETLNDDLRRWSVIALHFPKWTDGRAYSQARLLRARLRFAGEVRATGEVLVDMLPLLRRSGFDAAQLRADQDVISAQRALQFFPGHYQGDVLQQRPYFLRRAA
jgi:uncharacterized protein (DUF934 family)